MGRPEEINFGFKHEDEKIWALNLPGEEVELSILEDNLNIPYLEKEGTDDWNLTPKELIENFQNEPTHYARIQNVSLEYPIKIYFFRGSWKILDGVHRYCKAIMEGRKSIMACKVNKDMIPKILK